MSRNKCQYEINGDVLTIITAKGERILADAIYEEQLRRHSWCVSVQGYAVSNINGNAKKMHLFLFGSPPKGLVTDHINRNKLDNRECNLRLCSARENSKNQSIGKNNRTGVPGMRITPKGRFVARITVDRKEIRIGTFDSFEEAKAARIKAEKMYYGEFAPCLSGY